MASCTYPNHASFVTGLPPSGHGIYANHVIRNGSVAGAWEAGPLASTLFDRFGGESIAVLGDHQLVGVMGAQAAASHWPPDGQLTPDITLDPLAYPADESVLPPLIGALEEGPRLVVGYFGSIDTYSHIHGPESEEAADAYRRIDARIEDLEAALDWDQSVVLVVSDHVQDTAENLPGIDLRKAVGNETLVIDEGSAALLSHTPDPGALDAVEGVEGWEVLGDGNVLAWCERGRFFGPFESPILRGVHGGAHTRTQLALVSGGHPDRNRLAAMINSGPVPAQAWAPALTSLLG